MKKVEHDDFCPCARFRTGLEFCTCGAYSAAATQEIVDEVSNDFANRLREIMNPTPAPKVRGLEDAVLAERQRCFQIAKDFETRNLAHMNSFKGELTKGLFESVAAEARKIAEAITAAAEGK